MKELQNYSSDVMANNNSKENCHVKVIHDHEIESNSESVFLTISRLTVTIIFDLLISKSNPFISVSQLHLLRENGTQKCTHYMYFMSFDC